MEKKIVFTCVVIASMLFSIFASMPLDGRIQTKEIDFSSIAIGKNISFDKTSPVDNTPLLTVVDDSIGEVTKQIWDPDTSTWVNSLTASRGDILQYKIKIKYMPQFQESCIIYNINVTDVLSNGMIYNNDAYVKLGDDTFPGHSRFSGNTIKWFLSEYPFNIKLYNITKQIYWSKYDIVTIFYSITVAQDASAVETNTVTVSAFETCPHRSLYQTTDATIYIEGEVDYDLTVEKYVKWDCTPPYKKNVTADVGDWVTFKLYVNNTGLILL